MKIFIIILLLIFTSYSADFADDSLIQKVEKKYNKFAKNRFVTLNKLLKKLETSDTKTKLEKVNDFFNAVKYGPPLHKGTKCDMRFKSSLNSARLNLLNPYK